MVCGASREAPICEALNTGEGLKPGELIVKVSLEGELASLPHAHIKKVQIEKIGYPLISVSTVLCQGFVRFAVSGLCSYPVRLRDIPLETCNIEEEVFKSLKNVTMPILDDYAGSAAYRKFILEKTIQKIVRSYKS
jgi:xanthine dehydrogenase molybdenum-binding subunit